MFFIVSKVAWALLAPSTALIATGAACVIAARLAPRWRAAALQLLGVVMTLLAIVSFTSLSCLALAPLERRFPPERPATAAGIIVLGGAVSFRDTDFGPRADLGEAADRIREAVRLAQGYPDAPIYIVGGNVIPRRGRPPESRAIAVMLQEFGVARDRLVLETQSRTTAENARFLASLEHARSGGWLLVTSAAHMPRAMGVFRAAGFSNLYAAPTDWRCSCSDGPFMFDAVGNLGRLDAAAKEYLGLAGYYLSGRSPTLFPAPALKVSKPEPI